MNLNPSPTGGITSFVLDPLAPQTPAPPCDGDCLAVNALLFDGTLADESELLDIESFTDIGSGNWADYVDLQVEATGPSDALLKFNSGIPDPANDVPTMAVPSGGSMAVRVVPDDIYHVTLLNAADQPTDIKVTAIGWAPALDEAEEQAREDAIDEIAQELLDRGEELSIPQSPLVDEHTPIPETVCNEDDECLVFLGPGAAPPADPRPLGDTQQGRNGTTSLFKDVTKSEGANTYAEPANCDSGAHTGEWILVDRFNACAVVDSVLLKLVPTPLSWSTVWRVKVEQRIKLDPSTSVIQHAFRLSATSGFGGLSLLPLQVHVEGECSICASEDIPRTSTGVVFAAPGMDQSAWAVHDIEVDVDQFDIQPKTSRSTNGENIRFEIRADHAPLPSISRASRFSPPLIRCDGGNKVISGTAKGPGKPGCVFPNAPTPELNLDAVEYPEHVAMVTEGQERIAGHPGRVNHPTPLTRISSWDHYSGPQSRRSSSVRKNRSKALKMCRKLVFNKKKNHTCDEYPYATTLQGCGLSEVPVGPRCVVRAVPGRENFGAGGKLSAFLRQQRLWPGESYYVGTVTVQPEAARSHRASERD